MGERTYYLWKVTFVNNMPGEQDQHEFIVTNDEEFTTAVATAEELFVEAYDKIERHGYATAFEEMEDESTPNK